VAQCNEIHPITCSCSHLIRLPRERFNCRSRQRAASRSGNISRAKSLHGPSAFVDFTCPELCSFSLF
jgi:hypothetical protein